ncbi:MAG: hypothetical protein WA056_02135 [Gallionella sp.]
MSLLTRIKKGISTVMGFDEIRKNAKWIAGLSQLLNVKQYPFHEIKMLAFLKPNHDKFEESFERNGLSQSEFKKIHRNYVWCSYIGVIGFAVSCIIMITNGGWSYLPGVGACFITASVWLRNAYLSYCLNHRCCDGFMQFVATPSEYLPNPVLTTTPSEYLHNLGLTKIR